MPGAGNQSANGSSRSAARLTSHSIVPTMEPTRLVMLACKAGFWSSNTDSSVEPARGRPEMKCCRDPSGNGPDPHGRYLLRDAPHAGAAFERHQEFGMVAGALDTQCFEPLRLQPYLRGDEGVGAAMADTGAVEVGPTLAGQHRGDHLIASKTSIITLRRVRHHPTSGDRPPQLPRVSPTPSRNPGPVFLSLPIQHSVLAVVSALSVTVGRCRNGSASFSVRLQDGFALTLPLDLLDQHSRSRRAGRGGEWAAGAGRKARELSGS